MTYRIPFVQSGNMLGYAEARAQYRAKVRWDPKQEYGGWW